MNKPVDQQLLHELNSLSFHAFEQCIRELLSSMGYAQVELMGRIHTKQFTRHGGLDMQAHSRLGVTETPVILQLKQYRRPVSRRFVDELRGTMLRRHAGQGLIISTGPFSKIARMVAASNKLAPVRLIDGEELAALLSLHQIGLKRRGRGWQIDRGYFKRLRQQYPLERKGKASAQSVYLQESKEKLTSTNFFGGLMLWKTHVAAGVGSLWLLQALPGGLNKENLPLLIGLSALGALLPDLDAAEAKIKHIGLYGVQPFAPLSSLMHQTFGHRGRLHSLAGLAVVSALSLPLGYFWGWQAPLALSLGYASHLGLDACTRTGIPLIRSSQRIHLLPKPWRFVTGSLAEEALFPPLALVVLLLVLRFLPLL